MGAACRRVGLVRFAQIHSGRYTLRCPTCLSASLSGRDGALNRGWRLLTSLLSLSSLHPPPHPSQPCTSLGNSPLCWTLSLPIQRPMSCSDQLPLLSFKSSTPDQRRARYTRVPSKGLFFETQTHSCSTWQARALRADGGSDRLSRQSSSNTSAHLFSLTLHPIRLLCTPHFAETPTFSRRS